jgi:hypothetical protein
MVRQEGDSSEFAAHGLELTPLGRYASCDTRAVKTVLK